jgi:hypothetical protein
MLRPDATAQEIERAVAGSSFRRMREIEEADIRERRVGIFYKPYLQGAIDGGSRFMRSGRTGDADTLLSDAQRARFGETFGPLLKALGYSVDRGAPARTESHGL